MKKTVIRIPRSILCGIALLAVLTTAAQQKPNIIFVMMDDVGYGDIGRLGSPIIQTPNLDKLYDKSVRLTNYHTATTCSPTRAGIMTGQHYNKIGVWHTIISRSLLRPGIATLPEVLVKNGYSTGIFGKWHLGDNYPMRAEDRGFQYTLIHRGGGVGQTPDYWNNDYFDDTYWRNGVPEKFTGYCTDIWFREAMQYIEGKAKEQQPFFCYLPLNAAHQPHRAPQHNIDKYKNVAGVIDPVYNAMVDNIDENMGLLMKKLEELKIENNTILIFTSDNGTSPKAGVLIDEKGFVTKGYNAGMRGVKAQAYEGGHREPFFIRYPAGGLSNGHDVTHLSSCLDMLPTLLALCGIANTLPGIDGENILSYLQGQPANKDKIYITDTQRDRYLTKYKEYAVMKENWRLVNGELFDLATDPEQRKDLAAQYPDLVTALKKEYEKWWAQVEKENKKYPFVRIPVLAKGQTEINAMDLFPDDDKYTAWNQVLIRKEQNNTSGVWKLKVEQAGKYEVIVRQFPLEAKDNELPVFAEPGESFIQVNDMPQLKSNAVTVKKVRYTIQLPKGEIDFRAGFADAKGKKVAAQYVYFKKL